jgi:hypothetical protein
MSSGSSGRKHQPSQHDPKAATDMEPAAGWAALHRPQRNDKLTTKDASHAAEETKKSGKEKSTGEKKASL